MNFIRSLTLLTILSSLSILSADDVDAFLKKARAQLGSEKALESVETLHYSGEVYSPDGKKLANLELYFDKPSNQLLRENRDGLINQMAVNGFEGYQMSTDPAQPGQEVIQVMRPHQVKRLMSNAVENLYFFNGPKQVRGGEIKDEGQVEYNGKPARKIVFNYPYGLTYTRYFDPQSAKLLATVDGQGSTMVEKEVLEASGVKFPKIVVTYNEIGEKVHQVEFTEVKVNEEFEPTLFDFPN